MAKRKRRTFTPEFNEVVSPLFEPTEYTLSFFNLRKSCCFYQLGD